MSQKAQATAATVANDSTPCTQDKRSTNKSKNLFELIEQERAQDKILKEIGRPHKVKEIDNGSNNKGLFEDKLDISGKMGGQARVNRKKGGKDRKKKSDKLYESQKLQRIGIILTKGDYALVRCARSKSNYTHGCHGLMIVKDGQTRATCPETWRSSRSVSCRFRRGT